MDANRNVYVANIDCAASQPLGGYITEYPVGEYGNIKPRGEILNRRNTILCPLALALDSKSHVYIANDGALVVPVYSPGANGRAKPEQKIEGKRTGLVHGDGITVDSSYNIYVANEPNAGPGEVLVFAAGANGNVKPIRKIAGTNTGITTPDGMLIH